MVNKAHDLIPGEGESKIDLFRRRKVRKIMHDNEWWFSVKDVLEVLTDTTEGNRYSRDLRAKDDGLKSTWAEITRTLPFQTATRGIQLMTFINIEGIFRLMQSVTSPKAEPFKKWLARVGFERLEEIENPELAIRRAITIYRAKGYGDEWIDTRIRNKASREILTAEWARRGMTNNIALLTDAISVETFGLGVQRHKQYKGLAKHHSLRDNMTPIELTLTTLGEQATTAISTANNPTTLQHNLDIARKGGKIAGSARKEIEQSTGKKVISPNNYLTEKQRRLSTQNNSPSLDSMLNKYLNTSL
jgi:hypothetical protein